MSIGATVARARRLNVRARCELSIGGEPVRGFSENISSSGVHVRFPRPTLRDSNLTLRSQHEVSIVLPDQHGEARAFMEIVWLDPTEVDTGGQAALGVGLRMVRCGKRDRQRLERFIDTFRYPVLILHSDSSVRSAAAAALENEYRVVQCGDASEALERMQHEAIAVIICRAPAAALPASAALKNVGQSVVHPQVVLLPHAAGDAGEAGTATEDGSALWQVPHAAPMDLLASVRPAVAAYAMHVENEQLRAALERSNARLRQENAYLRRRVAPRQSVEGIIGESAELREALVHLKQVGQTDATVHIRGETGTGKEIIARALHESGPRASGPFIAQNCATFTESLLQSALFGHRRGAFTGADRDQPGVFQSADGGTLFLDEVAELSAGVQATLLRALQDGSVTPVGAARASKVDVRLISATHKQLRDEVEAGRFRGDLYFRLAVVGVELPPLRARQGDVALLAVHFLDLYCERYSKRVGGFSTEAMRVLEAYAWPGNVRELENEIERLVVLSDNGARVLPTDMSPHIVSSVTRQAPSADILDTLGEALSKRLLCGECTLDEALAQLEVRLLRDALHANDSNRSRTARQIGLPRQTLVSRLRKHGLSR